MTGIWRTVRVFISSTFRDMHAERDHLVKVVFPALREELEKHRVHLVDIDLRWGVTKEQADNDEALDVCLDQIDACRPFFIGILGERYGWVPTRYPADALQEFGWIQQHTGKSVTELEILHGVLQNQQMRGRAFFYFRDPIPLRSVPEAIRRSVYADTDPERIRKLEDLKRQVRYSGYPVMEHYSARWDPQAYDRPSRSHGRLVGLESFGESIRNQLRQAIQEEFQLSEHPPVVTADPLAEEQDYHERFMESRLRVYVGREQINDSLLAFADGNDFVPCLVTGPSGLGKSAALARFVRDCQHQQPQTLVIGHFIGASPRSSNLRDMLRRFCQVLKARFGFAEDVPEEAAKLSVAFREFVGKVPADTRVLLVIDALNQLDEADRAQELYWLPSELPAQVKVIVSCITDSGKTEPVLEAFRSRKHCPVPLTALSDAEQRLIIRHVPSLSAKTLDDDQVRLLLSNPATANPLFLLVALEELRGFAPFERLNERIAGFPREGDTVTAIFTQVIERLNEEFNQKLVEAVLTLLASARRGLSERELQELVAGLEGADDLFPVLRQLRSYLQYRGQLWDFFHRNLYKAVREKYLTTDSARGAAHAGLAAYFVAQGFNNPRVLDELPYQLTLSRLWHELFNVLTSFDFLTRKCATENLNVSEVIADYERALDAWPAASELPTPEGKPVLAAFHETIVSHQAEWAESCDRLLQQCYPHLIWWQHAGPRDLQSVAPVGRWLSQANVARHRAGRPWLRQITCPHYEAKARQIWHRGVNQAFFTSGDKSIVTVGEGTRRWDSHNLVPLPCPAEAVESPRVLVGSYIGLGFERSTPAALHGRWLAVTAGPRAKAFRTDSWSELCVFDLDTGSLVAQWSTGRVPIHGIAWSPTGDALATTTHNRRVCLWSFPSGALQCELWPSEYGDTVDYAERRNPGSEWPTPPAFSPDGTLVAVGIDEDCCLWNVLSGQREVVLNDGESIDSDVKERMGLRGASPSISVVQFSHDGRFLAAGKWKGSIRIWDVSQRRPMSLLRGPSALEDLAWSPQGDSITAAFHHAGVLTWRLAGAETPRRLAQCHSPAHSVEYSRNGQWVVVSEDSGICHVCEVRADCRDGSYWRQPSVAHRDERLQRPVAWGRDHSLVAAGVKGSLCRIDARTGHIVAEGTVNSSEANALCSDLPDGRVVVGTLDERVLIYDGNLTCERELELEGFGPITGIRLSRSDERSLMVAGTRRFCVVDVHSLARWEPANIEKWNVQTQTFQDGLIGAVIRERDEPTENLVCYVWKFLASRPPHRLLRAVIPKTNDSQLRAGVCEFTRDGTALWVGGGQEVNTSDFHLADAHCNVIDASTGRSEFVEGQGMRGLVYRMSADPRGEFVATQGADEWIRIWSISNRGLIHRLQCQHAWQFHGLAWSAGGDYLAAAGTRGISIWRRDGAFLGTSPQTQARGNVAWHPSDPLFGYVAGNGEPCIVSLEQ